MSKAKTVFYCSSCGNKSPQWSGRCSGCGEWNTLAEQTTGGTSRASGAKPVSLGEVTTVAAAAKSTGVPELDRVLGGGLLPGSVTLLGGEPGIGKSTMVLQLCAAMAGDGSKCLVVTGEESAEQVTRRAQRLGADVREVLLLAETDVESILATIADIKPDVVIVDSVQTMSAAGVGSASGTPSQVRESALAFTSLAKQTDTAVILVGHVTKDGTLAGPRVLEHIVDTVLEFEGDRHHALRFIRAAKHRFGATDEVGVFEMTESGLRSVTDASGIFLDDRRPGSPGSVIVPTLQGRRPLLVELQALVAGQELPNPRRVAQGIDSARLAVVLAVLDQRAELKVAKSDVYASVIGGVRIDDPGADLALALAVASSVMNKALPDDLIAVGEIGLGGELRKVSHLPKRLSEASRMGFRRAIVPEGSPDGPPELKMIRVATLGEAIFKLKQVKPAIALVT